MLIEDGFFVGNKVRCDDGCAIWLATPKANPAYHDAIDGACVVKAV